MDTLTGQRSPRRCADRRGTKRDVRLKIGFVSLFHAALSLQWFLDKNRGTSLLHEDAVQRIKSIVVADAVRSVRKKSTLRHHLFHYDLKPKVKKRIAPLLDPHLPLYGLVEAHTSGKSLSEIAQDVDRGLDLVSNGLRALLPPKLTPQGAP